MNRIWIIALNTISDMFRRKVLYIGGVATLVFELPSIATFFQSRYLTQAEFLQAAFVHQRNTIAFFNVWTTASIYLGIALSSVVLSWELRDRTILTVLARPVSRVEFLIAKWLGVLITTLAFLAIGVILGVLYAWDLNVAILPMLKLALAATVVSIVCFSAVGMTLSTFLSPVTTSIIGIFMVMAPDLVKYLFAHRLALVRAIASVLYFAFPSGMPVSLISESFGKVILSPNYGLYSRVMLENFLYGAFAFLLAGVVFSRRQI